MVRHYICLSTKSRHSGFSPLKNGPEFQFTVRDYMCLCLIIHFVSYVISYDVLSYCCYLLAAAFLHPDHIFHSYTILSYTLGFVCTPMLEDLNTYIVLQFIFYTLTIIHFILFYITITCNSRCLCVSW